jgi:hypothetical protein
MSDSVTAQSVGFRGKAISREYNLLLWEAVIDNLRKPSKRSATPISLCGSSFTSTPNLFS